MTRVLTVLVSLTVWLSCSLVQAHAFTPLAVLIEERAPLHYQVTFRRSTQFVAALSLQLPKVCQEQKRATTVEGDQTIDRFALVCAKPLQGEVVRVLGLAELSLGAVVYIELLDGRSVRELLSPTRLSLVVPDGSWLAEVFFDYVWLGIDHLLTGLDHVLFVIGLLFLVSGVRRVLWTLTAFTLGHSVTLCLSALSILTLPQGPVEVGIAISLLFVALEIVRAPAQTESQRAPSIANGRPFRIALAFGLLHGLGFAGALAETGLPEGDIPLSLFSFNLGVELGQVLVVCATLPLSWGLRRWPQKTPRALRWGAAYVIGSLSGMWFIERVAGLFA